MIFSVSHTDRVRPCTAETLHDSCLYPVAPPPRPVHYAVFCTLLLCVDMIAQGPSECSATAFFRAATGQHDLERCFDDLIASLSHRCKLLLVSNSVRNAASEGWIGEAARRTQAQSHSRQPWKQQNPLKLSLLMCYKCCSVPLYALLNDSIVDT